jgi:SAM-dependent methyltransferase
MAPGWDRRSAYFERIARPVTEQMLQRLAPRPGETILDLAAGSGAVGLAAAGLVGAGGRVIVSDFSEAMVEAARRNAARSGLANVECRVLDAERIALDDDAVDGVLCRWGYMLMADPAAALAGTRRVLRPGGRLACAVFSGPEENPWAALPARVLEERGHLSPSARDAPGIFALADPDRLRGLLAGAGFSEPRIEPVPLTWRFADAGDYWAYLTEAAGAIAMVLARIDEAERARVRALIAERTTPFTGDGGIALPGVSLVVSAS